MEVFQILFLFIFGLCVGSFLNVLIDRLPKGEQIIKGRSRCDSCGHTLNWQDLIPFFSWALLHGRCRYCHSPIPCQNPLVELTTGGFFVVAPAWVMGWCGKPTHCYMAILLYGYIASSLIVIFFTDLKYQIIPDKIVFLAIIVSFFYTLHVSLYTLPAFLLSALAAGGFFLSLVIFTRGKGMGMGDVKLAFLMGLILGFPTIVIALYLAFLTGAMVGVILILTGKKRFGEPIPFGPFLVMATVAAIFWGDKVINWWQGLIS